MAALDAVSVGILLARFWSLAGILSSLVALRFGAPLLLVFLLVGMLAGEAGPLGIQFDDVRLAYTIGSVALALILFDGGLRTRYPTFRNVIGPAGLLATVGVLVTAALTAPAAVLALGLGWTEALLVGAVVASTDAAAVFFLLHAKGLAAAAARQRDARGRIRHQRSVRDLPHHRAGRDHPARRQALARDRVVPGARRRWSARSSAISAAAAVVLVLNRLNLPQGLHAPFVATGAVVIFALAEVGHGSGFLAVYVAGLVVGNSAVRAHNAIVTFLDAATWLAQIGMFVVLGLLAWPDRLPQTLLPALAVAATLMLVARPAAVFLCLAPYPLQLAREDRSCPGSACAARSASSSPRSRCWSACRTRRSISTSASSSCWSRCWCRAGPSRRRRAGCGCRFRAAIRCRAGSSSICRASSSRRSWAIR